MGELAGSGSGSPARWKEAHYAEAASVCPQLPPQQPHVRSFARAHNSHRPSLGGRPALLNPRQGKSKEIGSAYLCPNKSHWWASELAKAVS